MAFKDYICIVAKRKSIELAAILLELKQEAVLQYFVIRIYNY
jgi:hypothetical protein